MEASLSCASHTNREFHSEEFYTNWSGIDLRTSPNFPSDPFENNAYTKTFPEEWVFNDELTSKDYRGCNEFRGWVVANREWWAFANDGGDEAGRDDFDSNGCENILVADGDLFNCELNNLNMDTYLFTPVIDITES